MYQCIGVPKRNFMHFSSSIGCGEKFSVDLDRCPICRGYLIPESMVEEHHRDNMRDESKTTIQPPSSGDQTKDTYSDGFNTNRVIQFLKQNQYDYELSENDESIKNVITWLLRMQ
ncbi:hypothetical protein HUB98_05885 [Paenibacillus barcinonensis]|uniref:Uncharacterized protein n=1 Tax=Paenibacillus barcinonensis TaxID=198119 RepID=A0A2V4VD76_PAEBA|nr:hypothetical protein [Paenibacillus barcinonensis]PYE51532.1 hypothetical protein DFQ00_102326 [Paenibacillus barcinonensis]QKS55911.1 hypothetical protein HUB98_05885 [Paenibacillus barcinonensis]